MTRRDIPNLITVMRLLLAPVAAGLLMAGDYGWALGVYVVAGASDGVDGFLAKRYGWQSELGGLLDPLADKLLMVSAILALAAEGLLPGWLVAVVVLRDVVILAGATAYWYLIGPFQAAPTAISKINTGVQIALVLFVLATEVARLEADLMPLFLLTVVMASASGVDYVARWGLRAWRASRH